jgi:hypothetical protein
VQYVIVAGVFVAVTLGVVAVGALMRRNGARHTAGPGSDEPTRLEGPFDSAVGPKAGREFGRVARGFLLALFLSAVIPRVVRSGFDAFRPPPLSLYFECERRVRRFVDGRWAVLPSDFVRCLDGYGGRQRAGEQDVGRRRASAIASS